MTDAADERDLEVLLDHLRDARAFDFTGYKRGSLTRRIRKRMQVVGLTSFAAYRDHLEAQPDEFAALFDTILINVTSFFRDRDVWNYVAGEVIPRILADKDDHQPVRAWSAGCASGEEAYSLATLLCEALGEERFRRQVKIYGTDADDDALTAARQARYKDSAVQAAFTPQQIERYFEPADGAFVFRSDLRRAVIFGRHDLVTDPPISRVDLLACRNTLMYFNAHAQRSILASFHFALNPNGYMVLGKSEALASRSNLFRIDDLKRHVFQKDGASRAGRPSIVVPARPPASPDALLQSSFETNPVSQLVLSAEGRLSFANRQARTMFGIGSSQIGRPVQDLEVSFRPLELRAPAEEVRATRRAVVRSDVVHSLPSGSTETFEVHFTPLGLDGSGGVSVLFIPVGRFASLQEEIDRVQRELETTHEELQSTVEELETTNEELQSTNEELETTNEELHSTNEELETMNEELQSTNEELETMNDELRQRTLALDDLSSFLQTILSSLPSGVAVLDHGMAVTMWNRQAEELWGLRADEVRGNHFLNLDIGLPVDSLGALIRACLAGQTSEARRDLRAINRRGRTIDCAVTVLPLHDGEDHPPGVIVLMDG